MEEIIELVSRAGLGWDNSSHVKVINQDGGNAIIQLDNTTYTIRKKDATVICIGKEV